MASTGRSRIESNRIVSIQSDPKSFDGMESNTIVADCPPSSQLVRRIRLTQFTSLHFTSLHSTRLVSSHLISNEKKSLNPHRSNQATKQIRDGGESDSTYQIEGGMKDHSIVSLRPIVKSSCINMTFRKVVGPPTESILRKRWACVRLVFQCVVLQSKKFFEKFHSLGFIAQGLVCPVVVRLTWVRFPVSP